MSNVTLPCPPLQNDREWVHLFCIGVSCHQHFLLEFCKSIAITNNIVSLLISFGIANLCALVNVGTLNTSKRNKYLSIFKWIRVTFCYAHTILGIGTQYHNASSFVGS